MKRIIIMAFVAAAITLNAQNSPFGIGTYNPNALLHIHQTRAQNPLLPPLPPYEGNREHFFDSTYHTTLLLTNLNTGSTSNDGFLMKQINLDMHFIQQEDGCIEFQTAGGKMVLSSAGYFGFGDTISTHRFNVQGTARFASDVKMTQSLTVDGTVSTGGALSVGGTLNTTSSLTVGSASSLGNMAVHGNTSLEFGLTVGGATNLQSTLSVGSYASVTGSLSVGGATTINGSLKVGNGFQCDAGGGLKVKYLKVTLTDWPDYVFSGGHRLMSLGELETYINEHSHLPGVPTAAEVEEQGADLGEMNKVLMEKVEELTLYIIDLHKQIDELKSNKNN